MKLAVDRTVVLGRPPYEIAATEDGSVLFALSHDGVRIVAQLPSREATALGIQLVQVAAVADFAARAKGAPSPPKPDVAL